MRALALLCLSSSLSVLGCPSSGGDAADAPPVPVLDDPRGLTTAGEPCNLMTSTIALHASMDTLDLDHGAVIFWVYKAGSIAWNGDFPAAGELAFRGYNIHRIGFPQEYQVCMPPGRYVIRAVQDTNHNGAVCEWGENWGMVEVNHPVADPTDARIVLDQVVSESDGCSVEETGLPSSGG